MSDYFALDVFVKRVRALSNALTLEVGSFLHTSYPLLICCLQNGRFAFSVFAFPTVLVSLQRRVLNANDEVVVNKGKTCFFQLPKKSTVGTGKATPLNLFILHVEEGEDEAVVAGKAVLDVNDTLREVRLSWAGLLLHLITGTTPQARVNPMMKSKSFVTCTLDDESGDEMYEVSLVIRVRKLPEDEACGIIGK